MIEMKAKLVFETHHYIEFMGLLFHSKLVMLLSQIVYIIIVDNNQSFP